MLEMNNVEWTHILDGSTELLITGAIGGLLGMYYSIAQLKQWKKDHEKTHEKLNGKK